MSNIDVSYSYWSHKRAWRVRAWRAPPPGQDFGRILSEEFKRTEAAAKKAAEQLAAQYGVKAQRI
ncbi:hypothetical protein [Mesorhizobium sp.]|uniref:hypothetical protein n=1 Tax=Mesorhizobium sp. TaxID=1871066 RepID=UPI0012014D05|nr:hypothetical protein [Mesorhizobium sp.]TIX28866.1 MAG: hypothetical protein E5V35_00460 [Mesorhizobium sp.]